MKSKLKTYNVAYFNSKNEIVKFDVVGVKNRIQAINEVLNMCYGENKKIYELLWIREVK